MNKITLRVADAGMLRAFINATDVGDSREGAEWENLYCKFPEMNEQIKVRSPSGTNRAKMHSKMSA